MHTATGEFVPEDLYLRDMARRFCEASDYTIREENKCNGLLWFQDY